MVSHGRYMVFLGVFVMTLGSVSLSDASAQPLDHVSVYSSIQVNRQQYAILQVPIDAHVNSSGNGIYGSHALSTSRFPSSQNMDFSSSPHHSLGGVHNVISGFLGGIKAVTNSIKNAIRTVSSVVSNVGSIISTGVTVIRGGLIGNAAKIILSGAKLQPLITPSAQVLANSAGKTPVILVHGSFCNSTTLHNYYDALEAAGIPTYAPTLGSGHSLLSLLSPALAGTAPVNTSAQQLSDVIDKVQKDTGASKVDIIDYSQGGLITRDYLVHDHKDNIQAVVSLAGSTHGTTVDGIVDHIHALPKFLQNVLLGATSILAGPAQVETMAGSSLVQELNKYPDTKAGVHYLNIGSTNDVLATPYQTAWLKPVPGADVKNIEVHSIPGVKQVFDHVQYALDPALVKYVVKYIEAKGEPTLRQYAPSPVISEPAPAMPSNSNMENTRKTAPPIVNLLN